MDSTGDRTIATTCPVCVFDNPATMTRECWQDGKLLCSYSAFALLRRLGPGETQPIPGDVFFFGANVGKWQLGSLEGDIEAMDKTAPGYAIAVDTLKAKGAWEE